MPNDKEFELDDLESFSFDDLSLDEAPAAGSDSGEDPFGVWVKSAPEDRDAGPPVETAEALDAEVVPQADPLPEEDFLSTEELANLDDSFEFVTVEEPLAGETPLESALEDEVAFLDTPEAIEAEKADSTALPTFDEISLDDFVTFDEVSPEVAAARSDAPTADALGSDNFDEEFLDIDIELDELGDNLEAVEAAPLPSAIEGGTEDIGLDEFGDFEEVSPLAASPGSESVLDDLPEMASLDEDPFLGDDGGFFEEEVFEEPGATLVDEGPVSLDLEPDDHTDLNHIMALEEHLTSGIRDSDAPAEAPQETDTGSDVAARLLGKIEQELSSIKQEISDLKREVTHLRAPGNARPIEPTPTATRGAPEAEVVEEAPAKAHGFFDEEDDETISLTDDELDNILSTAEVSEGEEAGVNLDEDLLGLDAEGNLVEPPAEHLTDEEFLAGTALADDEPLGGVPESIELEDALPDELDVGETEDLFSGADDGLELDPLPEGLLEGNPPPLELPSDDDLGLELADTGALTPDLIDDDVSFTEELSFETLDSELPADAGWSPPPAEATPPPPPVTLPTAPPAASAPSSSANPSLNPSSNSSMSPGLKDELRAVLSYMDKLLASLPDDKIQEFAESEHFEVYKRLFEELGLIE